MKRYNSTKFGITLLAGSEKTGFTDDGRTRDDSSPVVQWHKAELKMTLAFSRSKYPSAYVIWNLEPNFHPFGCTNNHFGVMAQF